MLRSSWTQRKMMRLQARPRAKPRILSKENVLLRRRLLQAVLSRFLIMIFWGMHGFFAKRNASRVKFCFSIDWLFGRAGRCTDSRQLVSGFVIRRAGC